MSAGLRAVLVGAAICFSSAVLAQPGASQEPAPGARVVKRSVEVHWSSPFASMSPEGRAIINDAMRRDRVPSNAEEVRRARQRVLDLIAADRLDIDAIRKAQAEERRVAMKEHAKAQERMLRAYRKLSPADRRAFAEGMRDQEERMMRHMQKARERMKNMERRIRERMERMERETGQLLIAPGGDFPPVALPPTSPLTPIGDHG
jgi:hypothetical protein